MMKTMTILAIAATFSAPAALAGPHKAAQKLERLDNRLDRAERRGAWAQGSRLDHIEDRIDRFEDRVDRREDRRDRAVNNGPLDRLEDRVDRLENKADRRENRRDRRR